MANRGRWVLLALLALGTTGCEYWYNKVPSPDDLMHAIPWFDHMIHQRSIHPYARADIPRNTVPGTVPISGSEGDWEAEFKAGNTTTADALVWIELIDTSGLSRGSFAVGIPARS